MSAVAQCGVLSPLKTREICDDDFETESSSQVIVIDSPPSDPTIEQKMKAAEAAWAFLNNPEEDVYTMDDGTPI